MSRDRSKPDAASPKWASGRLTLSSQNIVLAGVCGGLGEQGGMPVWAWRLIFLACLPVFFLGPIAYVALWIALPRKPGSKVQVPPLFRRVDWLSAALTMLIVLVGYVITLAPDLTLEDSGELAVGAYYAGVPHPPGYPVWTLYSWLFTVLVPFSNIAWRVALSSAVAGALASGLIALLASRGSSMMLESIEEFKNIEKKLENAICLVSGYVAGMLIGFNGFMWSQAVIVEVYTLSVLSLVGVLCCLLRWIYAPDQRKYLYWALFLFGICFTNHQTLIVAAMGIEIAIAAARPKLGRDLFLGNSLLFLGGLMLKVPSYEANGSIFIVFCVIGILSMAACVWLTVKTQGLGSEFFTAAVMFVFWVLGASFYFYMPLASMTNPPLNWGYPRTEEGFWHALTRGQYEKANPTDSIGKLIEQLGMLLQGAVEEFNLVYLIIALIPFLFYLRMQRREQAWLQGLVGMYAGLAVLLIILLNPSADRQSRELNRVFFTASHVMISLCIGYGLSLFSALMITSYDRFRRMALYGSTVAAAIAAYAVTVVFQTDQDSLLGQAGLLGLEPSFDPLIRATAVFSLVLAVSGIALFLACRNRVSMPALLGLLAIVPVESVLSHWSDNEQRGHLFGYWFGHDMFTPPFTAPDGSLSYDPQLRAAAREGPAGALVYPEMAREAILFGGTDPGRFCPTYMIFCESFTPPRCKSKDPNFDRRDVYIITQNALADGTYLEYIRAHYNRSTQADPPFFQEFLRPRSEHERGTTNFIARLAYRLLDVPLTQLGRRIEDERRARGVYPAKEINTPSPADHQRCFDEYMEDASRRYQLNQLKPGENVRFDPVTRKTAVTGQVAVMAINGLLTKVIFDKNPGHEFYVEESFALEWMYPYLEPYGIIMKINRQPLVSMSEDTLVRDRAFWSRYSERLIGNWITDETPVKDICDFVIRVYERRNFDGFTGDRKFVRDRQGQKSFSKLRSSIGGVYSWRYYYGTNPAEKERMLKEADFALRQAFAFCPYSPEAVYRYTTLLATAGRVEDAILVAETALRFDRENLHNQSLLTQLKDMRQRQVQFAQLQTNLSELERQYQANPTNGKLAFDIASVYLQNQNTNAALGVLDKLAANPLTDANTLLSIATAYVQLQQGGRLEKVLLRLVEVTPESPEAWFDLASTQGLLGKPAESIKALQRAVELSDRRLLTQPLAPNLRMNAATNPGLAGLRALPEFKTLLNLP